MRCEWQCATRSGVRTALGELPPAADNLALRAVGLLRRVSGINRGVALRLVKRIPSAAGLGGASTDAAAALVAADAAWNLHWPRQRLMELAAELGSDVPFFLLGGAAICRGRGERLEPTGPLGVLDVVVVRPPVGLSTADVYRRCRAAEHPRCVRPLVDALRCGDLARAGGLMSNRLESAAEELTPWIGRLRREFGRMHCPGHQMTGSGASYFALCRHARHARRVARSLNSLGVGHVYAVRTTT
jgi:4-diphosphocytidyl-2-C-methyl-D-erythritol kinase